MDKYLNVILEDNENVVGEIYIITNILELNKKYIGQTVSHRKNHKKFRPFGYIGRFKEHISEALCNTKSKQCNYLNNGIRKYGSDNFKVELITRCDVSRLDEFEKIYINKYDTLYPNGYNLTIGGSIFGTIKELDISNETTDYIKQKKNLKKTEETKNLISSRLKEFYKDETNRLERSKTIQQQHFKNKVKLIQDVNIDKTNLEQYLRLSNSSTNGQYYHVRINKTRIAFISKYETLEESKNRAIQFLKNL